jgi:hypothetical protein
MYSSSLSNIHDEIDVGVIVVVTSTRYFDITIGHSDVFGVDPQIFWGSHDGELYRTLVSESLVGPFSDGTDLLNGSNTVVGDQNLFSKT